MPRTAHITLVRRVQIEHATHPHAAMAGIGNDDGIVGQMRTQLLADAFGTHRHRVGLEQGVKLAAPLPDQLADALDPGGAALI